MSATALPLPLALSQPVPMTSDLTTLLSAGSAKYDPETQVGVHAGSIKTGTTRTTSVNFGLLQADDVVGDIA